MRKIISWLKERLFLSLKKITWSISVVTTATVAIGGALCGVTNVRGQIQGIRLGIASMIFAIGLPLGLIIFGPTFSIFIWLAIVISVLFAMNLHNTWEVIFSLRYGGLDYIMASQAVVAAESITPTQEDVEELRGRIKNLNAEVQRNANRLPVFEDGIIEEREYTRKRLILCTEEK